MLLKPKKFTIDNKELVTEINRISAIIEKLEATKADLMDRLIQFERAAEILTGKKSKMLKAAKATKSNLGPRAENKPIVEAAKTKIPSVLTNKPIMPKAIMTKLFETENFEWPMTYGYFDHVLRTLVKDGVIIRKPEGYVKNAHSDNKRSVSQE